MLHPHKCPSSRGGRACRQQRRCGGGRRSSPLGGSSSARRDCRLSETERSEVTGDSKAKALPLILTSVIREPLVAFPLEICAVKLGALVFTEITGSLRTLLSRRNTRVTDLIGDVRQTGSTLSCAWITLHPGSGFPLFHCVFEPRFVWKRSLLTLLTVSEVSFGSTPPPRGYCST